jgi:hypothetical protein
MELAEGRVEWVDVAVRDSIGQLTLTRRLERVDKF